MIVQQGHPVGANGIIIFGSPANNCMGNGICKVIPSFSRTYLQFDCVGYPATFTLNGSLLLIKVNIKEMHEVERKRRFESGVLIVDVDFVFSKYYQNKIGKKNLTILCGKYPAIIHDNCVVVKIMI